MRMLSVQADAAAAAQGSAGLERQLRAAGAERAALAEQADAGKRELLELQVWAAPVVAGGSAGADSGRPHLSACISMPCTLAVQQLHTGEVHSS